MVMRTAALLLLLLAALAVPAGTASAVSHHQTQAAAADQDPAERPRHAGHHDERESGVDVTCCGIGCLAGAVLAAAAVPVQPRLDGRHALPVPGRVPPNPAPDSPFRPPS